MPIETLTMPALLGVLAPVLVAVITHVSWPAQWKRWVAIFVYVLMAALGWGILRFPDQGGMILAELSTVVAVGQLVYTILKPTGILSFIEAKTGGLDVSEKLSS